MIRENEFVRIASSNNTSPKEEFLIRTRYRNMSKIEKKKMSRHITKFKQNMNFSQWWNYIGGRIKEGHKIHKKNKNNWIKNDPKIEKLKEEVRSEKFKSYHKLK